MLADLAEDRPLLVLVDDVQWLDQASRDALLFAARRLHADSTAMIFAIRGDDPLLRTPGVPELALAGLDADSSGTLLAEHGDFAPAVRDRIVEETGGNPLALIELPRMMTAQQRAGHASPLALRVGTTPISSRVREAFEFQIKRLPDPTQTLLLTAAADDTGQLDVIVSAAKTLGTALEDLQPAEELKLISLDDGALTFRHPLIRGAVYHGAPLARRHAVHRALADVFKGGENTDRRGWHLAAAVTEPDETAAAALQTSAEYARERGDFAAALVAYRRAAQLSPDRLRRAHRLAAAAQAAGDAGDPQQAAALADQTAPSLADPVMLARLAQVRAAAAYEQGRHRLAHDMLVEAAVRVAEPDPDIAAFTLFDAITVGWAAGDLTAIADSAALFVKLPEPSGEGARLLCRVATALAQVAAGVSWGGLPALRDLFDGLSDHGHSLSLRERARITGWDMLVGDHESAYELAVALERECRAQGAISALPRILIRVARAQMFLGRHRDALASGAEGLRIATDIARSRDVGCASGVLAYLAAIEGDEKRTSTLAADALAEGMSPSGAWGMCALSLFDLSSGRYETALRRLEELSAGPARHSMINLYSQPDLLEAAVRLGQAERAEESLGRYESWAVHTGQPWANAVVLRCRALLAPDDRAGRYYAEAVRLHRQSGRPFEQARTQLLYGVWLRRARDRDGARSHLWSALQIFERLGAQRWVESTRGELRAAGEKQITRAPGSDLLRRLTEQELQIARLAASGMSNRDIGAQLFLSPRTIAYHLYKAYPKLGISSRVELARLNFDEAGD